MARIRTIFIFAVILCMYLPFATFGQGGIPRKYPSVVLVQLKAERNRINALANARKFKDLEVFKQDVMGVMIAMIRDFSDHFNYCPVYYFIDTNFDAVMAKRFHGVLLNADLSPATTFPISDTSSDYMIVYHGFPSRQHKSKRDKNADTTRSGVTVDDPAGRGLIINDSKFHQLGYVIRIDNDFFNFRRRKMKNPYKYVSKKFNIDYHASASEFNRELYGDRSRRNFLKNDRYMNNFSPE